MDSEEKQPGPVTWLKGCNTIDINVATLQGILQDWLARDVVSDNPSFASLPSVLLQDWLARDVVSRVFITGIKFNTGTGAHTVTISVTDTPPSI